MTTKTVIVQNRAGIHARPAAIIAQTANKFQSNIIIEKENLKVNAKSIMGIITMAASYETELIISADGSDEAAAIEAMEALFRNKFEEE
ncbi:MAG: HPr family phosphocarrier protein [Treponema sp.]